MVRTLTRVIFGFALACLAAGLTTVLFVTTPAGLAGATSETATSKLSQSLTLALKAATHLAVFSGAFVLIATALAEWRGWRSLAYYAATGAAIALAGFAAQVSSEVAGQPSVLHAYAATAFVTAGLVAGVVYWLAAGRLAGRRDHEGWDAVPPTNPSRPRIVVQAAPEPQSSPKPKKLAERVAKVDAPADNSEDNPSKSA